MMVTRTEATQVARNANVDIAGVGLDRRKVRETLKVAEQLEPSERQLVTAELATRLWLGQLTFENGHLYPDFENFMWLYFSKKKNLETRILDSMDACTISADAMRIYAKFLRGMFAASGKTRDEFYSDMLIEEGIHMGLGDIAFGERAMKFRERIIYSVHKEHLLVFYSTRLLLEAFSAYYNGRSVVTKKMLKEIYLYFEDNLPLSGKFSSYAKNDSLFNSGIESRCLPEL